mgnify:CR=1 FL=1
MVKNLFNPPKKVKLNLIRWDGYAFNLLAIFERTALEQGWAFDDFKKVEEYAKSSDYTHILQVLLAHIEHDPESTNIPPILEPSSTKP